VKSWLIADTDLFKFTWIADPQISPDGSTVAFVLTVVLNWEAALK
jgi:hypothetical protein